MVERKPEFDWFDKLILIVEDLETNHMLIDNILKRTNCRVLWAMDGESAVELCREHEDIDLVLMDIRLPGIDGYEATRQIRQFRPNLPIIAQSAYIYDNNKHKVFEAGCNDFIVKPIKKDILLKKCDKFFRD